MRIVALLGVKDEVELIRASISHLRSIGVDLTIACDAGSTDGTWEVLNALQSQDDLQVVNLSLPPKESRARKLALAREAGADWVLFLDADEFWLPATGSLKDCRSLADADILIVDRFNVPLTHRGQRRHEDFLPACYEELFLCVRTMPGFKISVKVQPAVPWILGANILPKVLARADVINTISAGAHSIKPVRGGKLREARPSDLLIAHVPFTTFERFERKVVNICEVIRVYPKFFTGTVGWHWRRWASLYRKGRLREEFDRQVLDEQQLAGLLESGIIRTAAAVFAGVPPVVKIP